MPSGGRAAKQKGDRRERQIVDRLRERGFWADRVPLSGAAGGEFSGDIEVRVLTTELPTKLECKARKDGRGFKTIKGWLGDNDGLVLMEDRAEPLVVLTLERFLDLWSDGIEDRLGDNLKQVHSVPDPEAAGT